jgi:hypothetical protein
MINTASKFNINFGDGDVMIYTGVSKDASGFAICAIMDELKHDLSQGSTTLTLGEFYDEIEDVSDVLVMSFSSVEAIDKVISLMNSLREDMLATETTVKQEAAE